MSLNFHSFVETQIATVIMSLFEQRSAILSRDQVEEISRRFVNKQGKLLVSFSCTQRAQEDEIVSQSPRRAGSRAAISE